MLKKLKIINNEIRGGTSSAPPSVLYNTTKYEGAILRKNVKSPKKPPSNQMTLKYFLDIFLLAN